MSDEAEIIFEPEDRPQPWWDTLMERYVAEAEFDELRRFISLWVVVEGQGVAEKMAETAAKNERFLRGTGPRPVE